MENPFETLNQKLDRITMLLEAISSELETSNKEL